MNGIDISKWQAGINLTKIQADFVIVKATESTGYVNYDFKRAFDQGLAAGKHMGVYHYAGGTDPIREAKHFVRTIEPCIGKAILCLDWERVGNVSYGYNDVSWCQRWLDYVRGATGVTPFIYISAGMQGKFSELLREYHFWAAQYANTNRVDGFVEHPWNEGAYQCDIRQYTPALYLPGWNGRLDGNKCYLSAEEWDACCKPIGDEQDEPKNILTIDEVAREVLNGRWGNGDERRERLEAAGYNYTEVQTRVNIIAADEEITRVAQAVIHGDYGNGSERHRRLTQAGYDYEVIQTRVNKIYGGK